MISLSCAALPLVAQQPTIPPTISRVWPAGMERGKTATFTLDGRNLTDSKALRAVLKRRGVELVLHGHDHIHSTIWLEGAGRQIPAVGVPSASALPHRHYPAAAYNLFSIARDGNQWRCVQTVRAIDADFRVKQIKQATLL